MEIFNEFTEAIGSNKSLANEKEVNAAVIKLEMFSQLFEGKVRSLRNFRESAWSADPETNNVNRKLCRQFQIVSCIYNDSSSSAIASGQFAYLLNSDSEPFVTDEDLDRTVGNSEHSMLMFCIAFNFLVAMFAELYNNKEIYFSQVALYERAQMFGLEIRNRVKVCERKLNDSRNELQNIWTINDLHNLFNSGKITIEWKDLLKSNFNWDDLLYIIRWRNIYFPIGQHSLQINSSVLFDKFKSIYSICCTDEFLQIQRLATEKRARDEAARKIREEKEERDEAQRLVSEEEQEQLQSSNSRKRSLVVDDDDNEPEVRNFVADDENLQDTDDDNDSKSRCTRKKILLSKGTNPKEKHTVSPVKEVRSGGKEDEESDQLSDANESENVQVPHQQSKCRFRILDDVDDDDDVFKTEDSDVDDDDYDDDDNDDDDDDIDVQVPHQQSKSKTQDSVDDDDDDNGDDEEMENNGDRFAKAEAHLEAFIRSLHNSSNVKNSTQVSQSLVIELLHANQELKQKEFEVSLELLFRFVAYQQPLSNFFIMCESAPYIFAEEGLSDDNDAENLSIVNSAEALVKSGTRRTNLIKSAQVYLSKLSENLLKFIRRYRKQIQTDDSVDILVQLYGTIPPETLHKYGALLNLAEVRKMICDVTREDEMFCELSKIKKFKNSRHFLMNHLIDKFCSRDVTTLSTGDARENILIIMHNLEIYKPGADNEMKKRIDQVLKIIKQYVSEENPYQFRANLPAVVLRSRSSLSRDYSKSDGNGKSKSSKSAKPKRNAKAAKASTSTESTAQNSSLIQGSSSSSPMAAVSSSANPMATVAVEVVPIAVAHVLPEQARVPSNLLEEIENTLFSIQSANTSRKRNSHQESTGAHTSQKLFHTVAAESSFTSQSPDRTVADSSQEPCLSVATRSFVSSRTTNRFTGESSFTSQTPDPSVALPYSQKSNLTPISKLPLVPPVTLPEKRKQTVLKHEDLDEMAGDFAHVEPDNAEKRQICLRFFQMSFHVLAEICYDWGFSVEELKCPSQSNIENFEDNRSIQTQYACQLWKMFATKLNTHRHDDMEGMDVVDPTTRSEDDGEDQIHADQADSLTAAGVALASASESDVAGNENGNDNSTNERRHDDMEGMEVVDSERRIDGDKANFAADTPPSISASDFASRDTSGDERRPDDKEGMDVVTAFANNEVGFEDSLLESAKLLSTSMVTTNAKKMIYPACVMTLYLHAIRAHFLTRPFFERGRKRSYAKLNSEEYEQKRKLLLMFQSGQPLTMSTISETYGCEDFNGERVITTVIKSMFFKDRCDSPLLIKRLVLPRVPRTEKNSAAECVEPDLLRELNLAISKCPSLSSSSPSSSTSSNNTDMSLVFIDIEPFDVVRNASTVMDFPNRIVISRQDSCSEAPVQYVYQTVGAIYKHVGGIDDEYIIRVFARDRFAGSFFLREFMLSNNSMKEIEDPLKGLLYIEDFDYIGGEIPTIELSKPKAKTAPSMFPSIIKHFGATSRSHTYSLDGLVLCLNDGQREGLVQGDNDKLLRAGDQQDNPTYWLMIQNSMSRLDPIFKCFGQTLHSREMDILEGNQKWLSDEIITAAVCKFSHVGEICKKFAADTQVTFIPIIAFSTIISVFKNIAYSLADSQSESDTESQTAKTKSKSKSKKPSTAPALPKKVMVAHFPGAYTLSKKMWQHENIFLNLRWCFSIVNYPDHSHWMFIAIHSGEKFFYIYDPLFQQSYHDAVELIVELYIDAEATNFATSPEQLNSLKFSNWTKCSSTSQRQPDKFNCGVMVLIQCFRAIVQIRSEDSRNMRFHQIKKALCAKWSCYTYPKGMVAYRSHLKDLLIEPTSQGTETTSQGTETLLPNVGFVYFSKTLQVYINDGGSLF
jgi:hypothetical protein